MQREKVTEPLAGMEDRATSWEDETSSDLSRTGREKRKRVDSRGRYDTDSDSDLSIVEGNIIAGSSKLAEGDTNAGMAHLIEEMITMLGKCTQIQGRLKDRMRKNLVKIRELNLASRNRASLPRMDEGLREKVRELEEEVINLRGELESREIWIMELHTAVAGPSSSKRGDLYCTR